MENENNSKLDALAKCVLKQEKDIKKLKKRQPRKMTAMKFVGVAFDPEKYKAGEAEINEALSDGFEVLRDFETGGGIVIALGKWEKKDKIRYVVFNRFLVQGASGEGITDDDLINGIPKFIKKHS